MIFDRSLGVNFINGMMIDSCVIERDVSGVYDAILDEDTGKLVPQDREVIYSGKCLVSRVMTKDKEFYEAEAPKFANTYRMLIPASVVAGEIGDFVRITATSNDPRIIGIEFTISDIEVFTHSTYRRVMIRSIEDSIGSIKGLE